MHKIHEKVHLDIYDNLVIVENGEVAGVVGKASLIKLINLLGIDKIIDLCDLVKPDFTVENVPQKVKKD